MTEEKSLVKVKENFFQKFLNSIKRWFNKVKPNSNLVENNEIKETNNKTENSTISTQMSDMAILEKLVKGEIEPSSVDNETKERIKDLCAKREAEIREKIRINNEKIAIMDKLIAEIREID